MADQAAAKKFLQELIKREDLKNKICCDCSNPNPQWASLSFAVFLCLQCAGVHRGFGVHISFVRSVSMDTWQDDQIKRMQLGGNGPFKEFMKSYVPIDQGGYKEGSTAYDTYHCWAATQYREKLDASLAGKPWSPSPPPPGAANPGINSSTPGRPSSAQGLRKSRASTRSTTATALRKDSPSPASFSNSCRGTPDPAVEHKTANESFFAALGQANAARPVGLPPSQGGRYQGFGNTPPPPQPTQPPSFGLSSAAAPSITDLQENPMAALSKGWSIFSAAVVGASRVVSESVIQPGMEKMKDPNLQANIKGYVSEAQKRAAMVGSSANEWSKNALGVDVAEQVGSVVDTVKDRLGGGPTAAGYGSLRLEADGDSSPLYYDADAFSGHRPVQHSPANVQSLSTTPQAKKDEWDDWKDF